jgi:hypothetical protein
MRDNMFRRFFGAGAGGAKEISSELNERAANDSFFS